jgi:uncharacterized tellurite resistance protein B-like protein
MIDIVKRFFSKVTADNEEANDTEASHDARVAVCALFLEIASIDEQFTPEELATLMAILKEKYDLSAEHADALVEEAEKARKEAIDYWRFAERINDNYTKEEKIEIIEMLWQIVFVDGKMDKYENYLMQKLGTLLRLSHQELMDAKVKVMRAK